MADFKHIQPEELTQSPFQLIGKDWMLITAEKEGKANTMTASWGGFGVMWGKNVVFTVIRPQRFTKEFVDGADTFSLSFFNEEYRKQLSYLGKVSGRDEDKITKAGLTLLHEQNTPYFGEAKLVVVCKKLFAQPYLPEHFSETEILGRCYPNADYHTLYISEVLDILVQE
ncbi:MAG: flavin reductase family protein [Angelakisella sp.]